MKQFLYRLPLLLLMLSAGPLLRAQTSTEPTCGRQWINSVDIDRAVAATAKTNPALYQRMMARSKGDAPRLSTASAGLGTEMSFFIVKNDQSIDEITATLVSQGPLSRIWIDNADLSRLENSSIIRRLIRELDSNSGANSRDPKKGILQNTVEVFGETPKVYEEDGRTDFLLSDLNVTILGYFSARDQSDQPGSNQMNLLYIDSKEGLSNPARLLNTIAHEFQHLIHHGRNKNSEIFFNEGCSEEAGLYCGGYVDRNNPSYLANTNVDLFHWADEVTQTDPDYQRAYTYIHYMNEQFGERFLYELVGAQKKGMQRVDEALAKLGHPLLYTNWQVAYKNFAVANLLQTHPDPHYGYKFKVSSSAQRTGRIKTTYKLNDYPAADQKALERFGIEYVKYVTPGTIKVNFDGTEFRIMAAAYNDGAIDIWELAPRTDYVLSKGYEPYDSITFALVSIFSTPQNITWSAAQVTLGIDDNTTAGARLAFNEITPNPATTHATVHFTAPAGSAVTLELVNTRGEIVRTMTDEEGYAGMRELRLPLDGISAGHYFVRLRQAGVSITQSLLVHQ